MATTSDRTDDNVGEKEQSSLTDKKTDTRSTIQSTNDNKKSDQTSPDINAEKTNEEQTVEKVTTKTEETTTTVTSSNSNEDKPKDENYTFPIAKGDEEHLTNFQRQKAKYFFNVNLGMFFRPSTKSFFLYIRFQILKIKDMLLGKMWNFIYW
jgi:hypothetical protein